HQGRAAHPGADRARQQRQLAHRTAARHVGHPNHCDAFVGRDPPRGGPPPASTRPIPEHRAMSSHTPSASISRLPISRAASDLAIDPNRASVTTWIAVLAAMIGSFMAILNIQITNASLLNIEGGIGTGV